MPTVLTELRIDASNYAAGAETKAAADRKMVESGAQAGASIEQTQRRLQPTQAAYERLARSVDPAIRGQAEFTKGASLLDRALASGVTTASEHDRLMGLLQNRWLAGAQAVSINTREVVSLGRALATGNFTEGSTALARMGLSAGGLSGAMLAATAAGAGFIGFIAAAAIRAEEANSAALKFDTTIRGMGLVFGQTGAEVQKFAADLARSGPFSEADTTKAAAALLKFQGVAVGAFQEILPLAKDVAAVTGETLPAAAEELAKAYTGNLEAISKLDQELQLHLSPAQFAYIRQLEEQNRTTDAARVLFQDLKDRVKGLADDGMTPAAKSTKGAGDAWRDFLDALGDAGGTAVLTGTLGFFTRLTQNAADFVDQLRGGITAMGILVDEASKTPAQRAGSIIGQNIPLPPAPPPIPLRNAPAGLAGGPPGSGAGTPGDIVAYDKAVADLTKKLDEETTALGRTAAAAGQDGAAALRARLQAEAGNLATDATVKAHIDAAVAIQAHIDALKMATEEQKKYQEALKGAQGTSDQLGLDNNGLAGLARASGISPAAMATQRRLNEAFSDTQGARDAAGGDSGKLAEVDALTAAIQRQLEVRDLLNQTIRSNDEDSKLQGTLSLKRLELSLMGQDAGLRAQELADLKLRNDLIEEGYEIGTKAFDDELAKRKLIADQIAAATVAIKQQQDQEKQNAETMKQLGAEIGSALEKFATGTGSAHTRLKELEQTLLKMTEQQLIFKPFETGFSNLFSPADKQQPVGGLAGMLSKGFVGLLFGSSASDTAAATANAGGTGATGAGSSSGGLWGLMFGSSAPNVSSVTGSGSSSSGGLWGLLFGSDSASSTLANATINVASATINAAGAGSAASGASGGGGLLGGLGSWIGSLFGGGDLGAASSFSDPIFGAAITGIAKGGVFSSGQLTKFAAGGIVQDPTYFNIGLMGEAGPESIMPLTRMPGGKLGISAAGAGGGHTFNISVDARGANDPEAVRRMVTAGIMEATPHIVRAASSNAVAASFGIMRQGGRGAQISGKR